jgi:hypothetical protein
VRTEQIELFSYYWDQIKSAPGIYVAGKNNDGKFYEVAVDLSYIPWFRSHTFELDINYDPTEPADANVWVHGVYKAKRRAEARFLQNAAKAIRSGPQGLESCYFQIAELHVLQVPLGWTILNYDIIVNTLVHLFTVY